MVSDDKKGAEQEVVSKKGAGQLAFEALTGFLRFVVQVMGCFTFILFFAVGVLPLSGSTFAAMAGITGDMPIVTVMALWLLPQMFVVGLACYATVAFCKWWWRKCREVSDKADVLFAKASAKRAEQKLTGGKGKKVLLEAAKADSGSKEGSEQGKAPGGASRRSKRRNRRNSASSDKRGNIKADANGSGGAGESEEKDG